MTRPSRGGCVLGSYCGTMQWPSRSQGRRPLVEHSPDAVPARNAVPLRTGSRRRTTILVESAPSVGPSQAHIADGVVDGALVPLAPTTEGEMALSVPSDSQLMIALQQAEAPDELVRLGQMAAAYLDATACRCRRCHAARSTSSPRWPRGWSRPLPRSCPSATPWRRPT